MKSTYILGIFAILAILSATTIFVLFNFFPVYRYTDGKEAEITPGINLSSNTQFRESTNDFGFEIIKQFKEHQTHHENIFFSPYSLFTALAMAYEGAEGNTADEMAAVLNIEQNNASFHQYIQALHTSLNSNTAYTLTTANALWLQYDYIFLESYLETVKTFYNAGLSTIDFSNPEQAAETINLWVEDNTNNLIQDLLSSDAIDPALTKLILTNAIYFNGTWEIQFDKENTTERPFTLASSELIDVPTMSLVNTEDVFNYTETDDFQMLELPYSGDDLSMIIVLPKDNTDVSTIIKSMSEETYIELIDSMRKQEVDIYLPTFTITTPLYSMVDMLSNLGIHDAFSMDADFSGIDGTFNLYIQYVFHKAHIEVNEEGTEAAAATAVVMTLKSVNGGGDSRILFDCDHPFLYLIQQKDTGAILFMGTMDNPLS